MHSHSSFSVEHNHVALHFVPAYSTVTRPVVACRCVPRTNTSLSATNNKQQPSTPTQPTSTMPATFERYPPPPQPPPLHKLANTTVAPSRIVRPATPTQTYSLPSTSSS